MLYKSKYLKSTQSLRYEAQDNVANQLQSVPSNILLKDIDIKYQEITQNFIEYNLNIYQEFKLDIRKIIEENYYKKNDEIIHIILNKVICVDVSCKLPQKSHMLPKSILVSIILNILLSYTFKYSIFMSLIYFTLTSIGIYACLLSYYSQKNT